MEEEDATHTLSVLRAHQLTKEQLLHGLGLGRSGLSVGNRETVKESLTRQYDSKPSMRAECADKLLTFVLNIYK